MGFSILRCHFARPAPLAIAELHPPEVAVPDVGPLPAAAAPLQHHHVETGRSSRCPVQPSQQGKFLLGDMKRYDLMV